MSRNFGLMRLPQNSSDLYPHISARDLLKNVRVLFIINRLAAIRGTEVARRKEETMSISAYVFIECTAGGAREVAGEVSKIQGVKRSNATTGPYDVVALIEADNVHILGEFIVTKIQALPGVLRTQTNVIVD